MKDIQDMVERGMKEFDNEQNIDLENTDNLIAVIKTKISEKVNSS